MSIFAARTAERLVQPEPPLRPLTPPLERPLGCRPTNGPAAAATDVHARRTRPGGGSHADHEAQTRLFVAKMARSGAAGARLQNFLSRRDARSRQTRESLTVSQSADPARSTAAQRRGSQLRVVRNEEKRTKSTRFFSFRALARMVPEITTQHHHMITRA